MSPQYHVVVFGWREGNLAGDVQSNGGVSVNDGDGEYYCFKTISKLIKWADKVGVVGLQRELEALNDNGRFDKEYTLMPDGRPVMIFRGIEKILYEKVVKQTKFELS